MMNLKFFKENTPRSLEELKKAYQKLAFKYHPDVTGKDTNKEMATINAEYEYLFEIVKNVRFNHLENKFYESSEETKETPSAFKNIIDKLIKVKSITVMVCGSWLWVTGETKPIKEDLKEMNFRFSKNKMAWYLHYEPFKKKNKKKFQLDEIMTLFGAKIYESREEELKMLN